MGADLSHPFRYLRGGERASPEGAEGTQVASHWSGVQADASVLRGVCEVRQLPLLLSSHTRCVLLCRSQAGASIGRITVLLSSFLLLLHWFCCIYNSIRETDPDLTDFQRYIRMYYLTLLLMNGDDVQMCVHSAAACSTSHIERI
eukprot:3504082-Prymnesium_polylepis.1